MQPLFLTKYIKSDIFTQNLSNELSNHDVNFDLIVSDINYNNCPCLLISPNTKPKNISLINSRKDAINIAKHPLIILNELDLNYISPLFELLEHKNYATIINIHTGLGSYGKKLSLETNDLDIIPNTFNLFEPIDLENMRKILKQSGKQYIRLLHKEIPTAIFDVNELGIIDAKLLENLNSISLKTYGFTGNDGTILATGSLFATAIQTGEILQKNNKHLNLFIMQNLNLSRNKEIIDNIKSSKKIFIIIDHKDSEQVKKHIINTLNQFKLVDIQINIISPKYEKLTTIFNEYQEEEADFNPNKLAERIISKL